MPATATVPVPTAATTPTDVEIESRFLDVYPELKSRAHRIARKFHSSKRDDIEAEIVASGWINFVQAAKAGRWLNGTQLGWAGLMFIRNCRSVAGSSSVDAMSPQTQQKNRASVFSITSLESQCHRVRSQREQLSHLEQDYLTSITQQEHDGPAVLAQMKIDWTALAKTLSMKQRRALYRLSRGEKKSDVARKLGVCPGRISQIITELKHRAYEFFSGDVALML